MSYVQGQRSLSLRFSFLNKLVSMAVRLNARKSAGPPKKKPAESARMSEGNTLTRQNTLCGAAMLFLLTCSAHAKPITFLGRQSARETSFVVHRSQLDSI